MARHLVFSLGVVTFVLFVGLGFLSDPAKASAPGQLITAVLRVLIVPLWLMRDTEMMVGMGDWPRPIEIIIGLPLLFAPCILADLLLNRLRRSGANRDHGSRDLITR